MKEFQQSLYLLCIKQECDRFIDAMLELKRLLVKSPDKSEALVTQIEYMIIHAARISKYFFTKTSKNKIKRERGDYLRKLLSVTNDSILDNRDLRDHLEHLDERIDKWSEKTNPNTYTNIVLISGSLKIEETAGFMKTTEEGSVINKAFYESCIRVYNKTTEEIHILGNVVSLRELFKEVSYIKNQIEKITLR